MAEYNPEMPSRQDFLKEVEFKLYSCPDFTILGRLYPGNKLHLHALWDGANMTPSLYKKALSAVSCIRAAAAEQGFDWIYTMVPDSLIKWENMLGFQVIEEWTNNNDPSSNWFLMKQPTRIV